MKFIIRSLVLGVVALLPAAAQVRAEDSAKAFAAAIAPEQAFEVCFDADALKAAQCAMDKCRQATGGSDECILTSACGRGWSGVMGVTTSEIHWSETVCGAPNEAAVLAALTAFCNAQSKYVTECFLSSVWDENGKEKTIEQMIRPKTSK